MNDTERDVREALDRLVRPAPPPLHTPTVLAAGRRARGAGRCWPAAPGWPACSRWSLDVEGRVAPSVVEVEIRYGSAETTVPAVNGTFQAALGVPYAELLGTVTSTVRAYDSAGRVVSASHPLDQWSMREQLRTCWVAPDGTVVVPARATPLAGACEPAVRWR